LKRFDFIKHFLIKKFSVQSIVKIFTQPDKYYYMIRISIDQIKVISKFNNIAKGYTDYGNI